MKLLREVASRDPHVAGPWVWHAVWMGSNAHWGSRWWGCPTSGAAGQKVVGVWGRKRPSRETWLVACGEGKEGQMGFHPPPSSSPSSQVSPEFSSGPRRWRGVAEAERQTWEGEEGSGAECH